jgi:hypothetical protein
MKLLTLLLFLSGCVVPYGEAPDTSAVATAQAGVPMRDITGLEARLLMLMDENVDADRAARLEALRSLLRRCRTWTPEAQRDLVVYLEAVLAVEERWRGDEGLEGFGPIAPVVPTGAIPEAVIIEDEGSPLAVPLVEESLSGPEPDPVDLPPVEDPVTVAPERNLEAMEADGLELVRESLSGEAYLEAIGQLDDLRDELAEAGGEPGEAWGTLRGEAVDGWVHRERERAGRLFLEARGIQDPTARLEAYQAVADILEGLLVAYPESSYASAITRNLQLVKRELGDGQSP